MKKRIKTIVVFSIIIGIIALSINTAFGNHTITYIQRIKYEIGETHFYYYRFTWWEYVKNFELSTTDLSILTFSYPAKTWTEMQGNVFQDQWWKALGDNLGVILNYIIMGVNILIYPLRIGGYLLKNLVVIFGINQDTTDQYNGLAWLINFINSATQNTTIPYIQ